MLNWHTQWEHRHPGKDHNDPDINAVTLVITNIYLRTVLKHYIEELPLLSDFSILGYFILTRHRHTLHITASIANKGSSLPGFLLAN